MLAYASSMSAFESSLLVVREFAGGSGPRMESMSALKSTGVGIDVGSCPDMIEMVSGGESIGIVGESQSSVL